MRNCLTDTTNFNPGQILSKSENVYLNIYIDWLSAKLMFWIEIRTIRRLYLQYQMVIQNRLKASQASIFSRYWFVISYLELKCWLSQIPNSKISFLASSVGQFEIIPMKYDKWKNVAYCFDAELFMYIFPIIK